MKISSKGRYALRLMLDIAQHDTGTPVRIKDISSRQDISDKYLEQIISILNKAGFVRSVRGPQGGYLLTKKPEEYTVGMILRITEGSLAPVACMEGEVNDCERLDDCVMIRIWKQLDKAINEVVDGITLSDLLAWSMEGSDNYCI
jgi:Rrf2 family protein